MLFCAHLLLQIVGRKQLLKELLKFIVVVSSS
jgi:hypothetical protein